MMAQRDRREYYRQWHQDHKEQVHQRHRAYAEKHRQAINERHSVYNKQYYQDNPEQFVDNRRKRQQEIRAFIQQQKVGLFCKRCGNADIRVLDFHHNDKRSKEASISSMAKRGWSNEHILQEIAKCEVLCSNCHRILHWEERQG
jgi:hypothetical protein